MDAKIGSGAANTNTFEPTSDLIQEEDCNTLLLYLPGFTKEQLRVQLTRSRVLKISGTRPIGINIFSSFQKDFPIPENCDTNRITAKFEDGILYVRQPKLIVPDKDDKKIVAPIETPQPKKPAEESPAPKIDQKSQPTENKATPTDDDHRKQSGAREFAEKRPEEREEKPTKEKEKVSERRDVAEESGGVDDDKKKAAAAAAARRESDKREKISGAKVDAAGKLDDYYAKLNAAAKLQMMREKVAVILVLVVAFALGMYVSRLPWFSREVGN